MVIGFVCETVMLFLVQKLFAYMDKVKFIETLKKKSKNLTHSLSKYIKHPAVLYGKAAIINGAISIDLVVNYEQSGVGLLQPSKSDIGRPDVRYAIELNQTLGKDPWGKGIRKTRAIHGSAELSSGQIEIVLLYRVFRVKSVPDTDAQRHIVDVPVAAEGSPQYMSGAYINWLTWIGLEYQLCFCMIIGTCWNNHIFENFKFLCNAFCSYIDSCVNFKATTPNPMIVYVQKTGFQESIEIPIAPI